MPSGHPAGASSLADPRRPHPALEQLQTQYSNASSRAIEAALKSSASQCRRVVEVAPQRARTQFGGDAGRIEGVEPVDDVEVIAEHFRVLLLHGTITTRPGEDRSSWGIVMKHRSVLFACVSILAIGGCSSPETQDSAVPPTEAPPSSIDTESTPTSPPATQIAPSSPANWLVTGIVVAQCLSGGTIRLQSHDSLTGNITGGVDFAGAETDYVPCQSGVYFQQQFDPDLQRMAVQMKGDDGGTHVGYLKPGGDQVDVTQPKTAGYGAEPPNFSSPRFNPKTGMLWFSDNATQRLGWFDTSSPATGSPRFLPGKYPGVSLFFSSDGSPLYRGSNGPVTPDGRSDVYYDPAVGYRFDTPPDPQHTHGLEDVLKLTGPVVAPGCRPDQFIDAKTFLCIGDGTTGSPHGIYKMTIRGRTISQAALLPPSKTMSVESVAVDSLHTQIAFLAVDRSTGKESLYITVLSDAGEPNKLTQLGEKRAGGPDWVLLAWK
jgi:hypothetical protein